MTTTNIPEAAIEAGARAAFDTRDDPYDMDEWEDLSASDRERDECTARVVLTAAWEHLHPVVETVEDWDDLRTLPGGTVIQQNSGGRMVLERSHGGWFAIGVEAPYTLRQATGFLPATVLHRGGDAL